MTAVPKPPKGKKKSASNSPKMTEDKLLEISERLADALEFKNEVTITTYRKGKYEKFTGIIESANPETKMITFNVGNFEHHKISANIIVDIE
ncbi:YolD-like family protein [Virgibacillus sp. Bac332]|uniref:YolD-like family protein n=1 Tax=Virgibacillus sp. Bac332 TaxID=2419842 RepID=UPI000EF43E19|nr:YolD-like family protein [Virgibacillus sp. Bac332]